MIAQCNAINGFILMAFWALAYGFDMTNTAAVTVTRRLWQLKRYSQCQRSVQRPLVLGSAIENETTSSSACYATNEDKDDEDSNPFDDPEPKAPPASQLPIQIKQLKLKRRQTVTINPYNIPKNPEEQWEWFYERLRVRYEARSKNHQVGPTDPIEESLLRHWMAMQRKSFMKSIGVIDLADKTNWGTEYLTRERKERLDLLGFHWGHLQSHSLTDDLVYSNDFQRKVRTNYKDWMWNPKFESLVRWKKDHQHTNVPLANGDDGLGTWVAHQRTIRWDMPQRRREKLDSISLDWTWKDDTIIKSTNKTAMVAETSKEKAVPFARRMSQLKDYRRTNGDCAVPLDYDVVPGLGIWVNDIRSRRREFSPGSIANLEKIGLAFNPDNESLL